MRRRAGGMFFGSSLTLGDNFYYEFYDAHRFTPNNPNLIVSG